MTRIASCSLPGVDQAVGGSTETTADFENIAGIFEGNDVMVLGIAVGKVGKIVPKGTFVEVHMTIESGVKIPKEAIAAIISPSIVTDRH
ncbi:MlaD family protein, partial [Nocardia sp. NPDC050413]|uniref:MlaD family protein n=1 Tax=Nocardia sp. NPDC050413 TaxID=3155784 RepID=UPI0033C86AA0